MTFFRHLFGVAREHPLAFVGFLFAVVVVLGGVVWGVLGFAFRQLRKVPGGSAVESAVTKVAKATGSA